MRLRIFPTLLLAVVCLVGSVSPGEGQCDPDGDVEFVCGPVSPEDLARVPRSPWILVSGMEDDGYLYATDVRDLTSSVLFPTPQAQPRHDRSTYGSCPGPVTGGFRPHGLSLRPGDNTTHTLYVVRHGEREAIEVFEFDAGVASPTLVWIGCVVAPEGVSMNSVAALPGGGFVVTNFQMAAGELLEWQPGEGWERVPGSVTAGPNGIVASDDGRWLYIGGWGTRSLIRLSRGQSPPQVSSVDVGHHVAHVVHGEDFTGQAGLVLGFQQLGLGITEAHVGVAAAAGHGIALAQGSASGIDGTEGLLEPGDRPV